MSNILFANNASTVLASPISSGATSVTLQTGTGAEFPNPTGGQYFIMTFVDAATGLLNEIVHVTARSGDTCTIIRAQEGTTAASWLAGDTGANFWTAGSVAALQAGFPTSTSTVTTSTTLTTANTGTFFRVTANGVVISLPSVASSSGMTFGVAALNACSIVTNGSDVFQGVTLDGLTTASLGVGEFLCVQSNGVIWLVFSGSPQTLYGTPLATESWVTANFDPLGAASTAQANAETYALGLQGNYRTVLPFNISEILSTLQFGCLAALVGASAPAVFYIPDGLAFGDSYGLINQSGPGLTIGIITGSSARFYGNGLDAASSFGLLTGQSATITWATGDWYVTFYSGAFDVAGAAAAAQVAAINSVLSTISGQLPLLTKTVSLSTTVANNTTYTITTQGITFPAFGITGGFRITGKAVLSTATTAAATLQNLQLSLTDGTNSDTGAAWLISNPQNASNEADIESSFIISHVYAEGATPTFTLKVSTLGGGGGSFTGQPILSACTLKLQVENA